MTSHLGWGTYRVPDIATASKIIVAAGCDWIDTAPNYANGLAHSALASTLAAHSSISISTKVGLLPRALMADVLDAGIIGAESEATGRCIEPGYVRWQTRRSCHDLGRSRVDVMFLHNPDECYVDKNELASAIIAAFTALEAEACDQTIDGYGVATWSGLTDGAFTVPDLVSYAEQAAGGSAHHFTAIQHPVSLVCMESLISALEDRGHLVQARDLGVNSFVSAPLHGGELPRIIDQELADHIAPGMTPAQAALAILAGIAGIDRVLLSTSHARHWEDARSALAAPVDYATARRVLDVLAA